MVFSTFILRYVESKFTLLTYLMENNTVITVISYCTKGLNNSKTKQKPIPTIYNKTLFRWYGNEVFHDWYYHYFTIKQYECKNVRMQRGFRVKRCSIKLWDLTGNGLLKCKNYALLWHNEADSVNNNNTFLFSWSFKNWNNICAGLCRSATRTWMGCYTIRACAFFILWVVGQVVLFIFGCRDGNKEWFVGYLVGLPNNPGVPSGDPFAPIWWTELLFTSHFLFFVHCFVCVTDYRIMFKSN